LLKNISYGTHDTIKVELTGALAVVLAFWVLFDFCSTALVVASTFLVPSLALTASLLAAGLFS
jgi:hypothetical protein